MKHDLLIKNGIVIPDHELEITASRAGGPGGQHVNKTSTRITVRWNVRASQALNENQKERLLEKLASQITAEGDFIIHNSASRSQEQNKRAALNQLADLIRRGLHVAKKRIPTQISEGKKEARLQAKRHRSNAKQLRSKKITPE